MSKWKLRSPDSFPKEYREAVASAIMNNTPDGYVLRANPAAEVIHRGYSIAEADYHADMFRCWRWCIRQYPLHELHPIERDFNIRVRRVQRHGLYELHVSVVPKVSVDPLLAALEIDGTEDFTEIS